MKRIFFTLISVVMGLALSAQPQQKLKPLPSFDFASERSSSVKLKPGSRNAEDARKQSAARLYATIINKQPKGILHEGLSRNSLSMTTNLGTTTDNVVFEGKVCKWVEGNDGYPYLFDPIVAFYTGAWMKGKWGGRGEKGDTIYMEGPQLLKEEDYSVIKYSYYATRLEYKNSAWSYNKNNKRTMFIWRGDSLLQPKVKNVGFGLVNADNEPFGIMDHTSVAKPMTDKLLTLPDELLAKKQEMIMRYCSTYVDTVWTSRRIQMVVDEAGKAIYLQNISDACPDAWIKGDINGDKVTFSDGQYLGVYEAQQYYAYLGGLTTELTWWEEQQQSYYKFDFGKPLTFTYDRKTGKLTSDGSGFAVMPGRHASYYISYCLHPQILPVTGEAKAPAKPSFSLGYCYQFGDWTSGGMAPFLSVQFSLPNFSEDGTTFLDNTKMSYIVYLDDMKYEMCPDEYSTLTEPMTEVPYEFTDEMYFYISGMVHALYLFEDCDSVGVQSIYTDGGKRYESPISYFKMNRATAFKPNMGEKYYDKSSLEWGTTPLGKAEHYDVARYYGSASDKGQQVTSVRVKLGEAKVKGLKVWAATSLEQIENGKATSVASDLIIKNSDITTGEAVIDFDIPVTIPDAGLYVGYSFEIESPEVYNISPVSLLKTETKNGFWCHTSRTYRHWRNLSYYGVLDIDAIMLDVADDAANLGSLSSSVGILGTSGQGENAQPAEDVKLTFGVVNLGNNGVRNFEYSCTVNGKTIVQTYDMGKKPVGSAKGDSAVVSIDLPISNFTEPGLYPLTFKLTKINGQTNALKAERKITVCVYEKKPKHRTVEEEYTGTWCGWCPRGLKALEMMNERHPDDFIAISYHNGDVMTLGVNYPSSVGGFPSAWIDRRISTDPYLGTREASLGIEADFNDCVSIVAPADVDVKATLNATSTVVDVEAAYTFALDNSKSQYKVEYILLHDDMHGSGNAWVQKNYYSGTNYTDPNLQEYVKGPAQLTNFHFNDVIVATSRQTSGYKNLPSTVKRGVPVNDTFSFTLSKVVNESNASLVQDVNKLRVVALLIDRNTGAIVNANQAKVTPATGINGVETTAGKSIKTIYDLNGRRTDKLQKGVNIVRYTDGTTRKIVR